MADCNQDKWLNCQNVTNKENTRNTVVGVKVTPYMNTQHIQAIHSVNFSIRDRRSE
jgi:hypothetical protein